MFEVQEFLLMRYFSFSGKQNLLTSGLNEIYSLITLYVVSKDQFKQCPFFS